MTFRPSRRSLFTTTAFFVVAGLVTSLADDVPTFARVMGWILVVLVPIAVAAVSRTRVQIEDARVTVRRIRSVRVYEAGVASVQLIKVPGGVIRDNTALQIITARGAKELVALGMFSKSDKLKVIQLVQNTLGQAAGGTP